MQNKEVEALLKSTEQLKEQQLNHKTVIMSVFSFASLVLLTLNGLHAIDIPWLYCLLPVGIEILLSLLGSLLLMIMVASLASVASSIARLK